MAGMNKMSGFMKVLEGLGLGRELGGLESGDMAPQDAFRVLANVFNPNPDDQFGDGQIQIGGDQLAQLLPEIVKLFDNEDAFGQDQNPGQEVFDNGVGVPQRLNKPENAIDGRFPSGRNPAKAAANEALSSISNQDLIAEALGMARQEEQERRRPFKVESLPRRRRRSV